MNSVDVPLHVGRAPVDFLADVASPGVSWGRLGWGGGWRGRLGFGILVVVVPGLDGFLFQSNLVFNLLDFLGIRLALLQVILQDSSLVNADV